MLLLCALALEPDEGSDKQADARFLKQDGQIVAVGRLHLQEDEHGKHGILADGNSTMNIEDADIR